MDLMSPLLCVRRLPVHPRPFAIAARTCKQLQCAVEAVREELAVQICEEQGLESARGKAAGLRLQELMGRGETAGVLGLIVVGAPINMRSEYGWTALMITALDGRTEIALALIGAGARLDLQQDNGTNALVRAAQGGHTEIAVALIKAGAALDCPGRFRQSNYGNRALLEAVERGHTDIATALIDTGARLDLKSAWRLAKAQGHAEIVAALIKADKARKQARRGVRPAEPARV